MNFTQFAPRHTQTACEINEMGPKEKKSCEQKRDSRSENWIYMCDCDGEGRSATKQRNENTQDSHRKSDVCFIIKFSHKEPRSKWFAGARERETKKKKRRNDESSQSMALRSAIGALFICFVFMSDASKHFIRKCVYALLPANDSIWFVCLPYARRHRTDSESQCDGWCGKRHSGRQKTRSRTLRCCLLQSRV